MALSVRGFVVIYIALTGLVLHRSTGSDFANSEPTPASASGTMKAGIVEDLKGLFDGVINAFTETTELFMKNLKARYPPVHKLFEGVAKLQDKLTSAKKLLLEKVMGKQENGSDSGYDLSQMSNDDVMRLLDDLEELPGTFRERLIANLANCTKAEIQKLPSNLLPAFGQSKFDELKTLGTDKLAALCTTLLDDGSSPWNLVTAVRGGLRCNPGPNLANKKKCKLSLSKVMMDLVRVEVPPKSWNSSYLEKVMSYIGAGVTREDIQSLQDHLVLDNIKVIAKTELPFESQRAALVSKMVSSYTTPTAWPDQLIIDMGKLLEDVQYQNLILVRHNAVENAALELSKAGIDKGITKITLSKAMMKAVKVSPTPERLARILPWMKGEVNFIQNLNMTNLVEAMERHNLSLDTLTHSEIYQLSKRVEKLKRLKYLVESNRTEEAQHYMIPELVPGFSVELLEVLPDDIILDIRNRTKAISSRVKAQLLVNRIKLIVSIEGKTLQPRDVGGLYNGLSLADINQFEPIDDKEVDVILPFLQAPTVPENVAWHVTRQVLMTWKINMIEKAKIEVPSASKVGRSCDDFLSKLGKLVKHVDHGFIKEYKLVPLGNGDESCDIDIDGLQLTRAQAYAVVDNIRETMGGRDESGNIVLKPRHIKHLGRLSIGLAADDIEKLPTDTELLTVIEALSKYEDELDSWQIQAIVGKIREYFDLENRNVVKEATDITAAQIGRFLQYLNVDFELPKFPKAIRPTIMREIGKSSLSKVSTPHRQKLLQFALKNTRVGNGAIEDVTRSSISEAHLIDLGRLKCGLTLNIVEKMTASAFDTYLEDIHECPFKDEVAKALVQKALHYNMNRLGLREHLAAMAGLLQYLDEGEMNQIDIKEITPITEYIVKASRSRDMAWEAIEKNGFIRERSSTDKQKNKENKQRLFQKLLFANQHFHGTTDKCPTLLKFGEDADVLNLYDYECLDETAGLPNWDNKQAYNAFLEVKKFMFKDEESAMFQAVWEAAGLLKGLSPQQLGELKITSDTIYLIGRINGLTAKQLSMTFKTFKQSMSRLERITAADFVNMQNVACGMSPTKIRSAADSSEIRIAISTLGRIKGCDEDQLTAFAEKYVEALGPEIPLWNISDINAMGNIIGGLTRQQLSRITHSQLQALEPSVISDMPPQKIADFTVAQLQEFTPHQSHAITSMQRSYMNTEQVAIIARTLANGSPVTVAPCLIVMVFALMVGQCS